MTALFDPGLQPERTELAWRRTCLALGVGSLVAMRLLPLAFGSAWWALAGLAGVIAAALLWVAARRRYRSTNDALTGRPVRRHLPDGRLLLALTLFSSGAGAMMLAVVGWMATAR